VARIYGLNFGTEVDGKQYHRDVLITADDKVRKRKGGFLTFGSHEVKKLEPEELSRGQPESITVGARTDGAPVDTEAQHPAEADNVSLVAQACCDTTAKLNDSGKQKKKVAALIHLTC